MGYDTAQNIVSDAAVQLGLGAVPDVFGSTDANVVQLRSLLRSVGRDLRRARQWTHLAKAWAFSTTLNVGRYSMPPDYGRFIPNTAWNRTNRLPVPGPLTPQEFQALKARLVGVVYNILFRVLQGQFQAFPDTTTPASYVIAFEYISNYWVTPQIQSTSTQWVTNTIYAASAYVFNAGYLYQTSAGGTSGATAPTHTSGTVSDGAVSWTFIGTYVHTSSGTWQNSTAYTSGTYFDNGGRVYKCTHSGTSGSTGPVGTGTGIADGSCTWDYVSPVGADDVATNLDVVLFDSHLVTRALKAYWQRANGFDSQATQEDFESAFAAASDDDSAGRTISITGSPFDEPMLSTRNLPITGYGM